MMQSKLLTVGIPTYNRRVAVERRLKELCSWPAFDLLEILVIDNASDDGTIRTIEALCKNTQIRLLSNDTNIGYARNVLRLFRECRTKYLLILSDEDSLDLKNLPALIDFLRVAEPTFVSPQLILGGQLYRGKKRLRRIVPGEYNKSSFYVSGLTYLVAEAILYTGVIEEIAQTNSAAYTYPQVLISASLLCNSENCYWWPEALCVKKEQLATQITDLSGSHYDRLAARWSQYDGFRRYFVELSHIVRSAKSSRRLERIIEVHKRTLFDVIRRSIQREKADVLGYFEIGALKWLLFRLPVRVLVTSAKMLKNRLLGK